MDNSHTIYVGCINLTDESLNNVKPNYHTLHNTDTTRHWPTPPPPKKEYPLHVVCLCVNCSFINMRVNCSERKQFCNR